MMSSGGQAHHPGSSEKAKRGRRPARSEEEKTHRVVEFCAELEKHRDCQDVVDAFLNGLEKAYNQYIRGDVMCSRMCICQALQTELNEWPKLLQYWQERSLAVYLWKWEEEEENNPHGALVITQLVEKWAAVLSQQGEASTHGIGKQQIYRGCKYIGLESGFDEKAISLIVVAMTRWRYTHLNDAQREEVTHKLRGPSFLSLREAASRIGQRFDRIDKAMRSIDYLANHSTPRPAVVPLGDSISTEGSNLENQSNPGMAVMPPEDSIATKIRSKMDLAFICDELSSSDGYNRV